MENKQKLLGYYNYTVVLTYIGMLCGFMGIIKVLKGDLFGAVLCLIAAGFCDMFDGTIASTRVRTEQEKCFGIQIDSLSDLVCFGVLPAVTAYSLSSDSKPAVFVCSMYVLCALIRLAFFNVDEQGRLREGGAPRETYQGLPVTMSALFLPLAMGTACFLPWERSAAAISVLLMMAVLFVLPFPVRKPRAAGKLCILLCGIIEICLIVSTGGSV